MPSLAVLAAVAFAALVAGCASAPADGTPWPDVQPFSSNAAGTDLPRGWQPWIINRAKAPTRYELVQDASTGRVVLHAVAESSASGLKQRLDVAPADRPLIAWDWRVVDLISAADNQDRYSEDAPVRLMLFFDGDRSRLPVKEQILVETVRLLTGQEMQWLADHPQIILAPGPGFPPIEHIDADGRYDGIACDYIRLIERKLGNGCHGDRHQRPGDSKQGSEGEKRQQGDKGIHSDRPLHDAWYQPYALAGLNDTGGNENPDRFLRVDR